VTQFYSHSLHLILYQLNWIERKDYERLMLGWLKFVVRKVWSHLNWNDWNTIFWFLSQPQNHFSLSNNNAIQNCYSPREIKINSIFRFKFIHSKINAENYVLFLTRELFFRAPHCNVKCFIDNWQLPQSRTHKNIKLHIFLSLSHSAAAACLLTHYCSQHTITAIICMKAYDWRHAKKTKKKERSVHSI
jgi:hypothetical protein